MFLQKRERKIDIEPDWVHLGVTENGIAVNSYFAEHPEMMLGAMEYDTRIYGQDSRYTVCVNDDENFNMYEALNKAISNIKAQILLLMVCFYTDMIILSIKIVLLLIALSVFCAGLYVAMLGDRKIGYFK